MCGYNQREKHAYGNDSIDRNYCKNPYILKWWNSKHDQILIEQIQREHWSWYWDITDKLVSVTPAEEIQAWRENDPLCSNYAWYNLIMGFSRSRAEVLGFTRNMRSPEWKKCPLCGEKFIESSLPVPFINRLGIENINFCSPCLTEVIYGESDILSKDQVIEYLQDLTEIIQRVPTQNYGQGIDDFRDLDFYTRLELFQLLKNKPSISRVKELFNSWLKALIDAGILENGTRRTGRGTQCIANDGHVCLSLGEKTIDDFLSNHGYIHIKEPPYPEGNYRADFQIGQVFLEYFGLKGNGEYDKKIIEKQKICKKHGIRLISIYPNDLISLKRLGKKLLVNYY